MGHQKKTKLSESFLRILWDEGLIVGYKIRLKKDIKIFLKYTSDGKPSINNLKIMTKPGRRVFFSVNQIWGIKSNEFIIIISTNKGLKTLKDCKKLKLGGEPFIAIN